MKETYDPEKLQAIMDECKAHNEAIGADEREPDRLRKDAEFIYLHRHTGVTVETLCMMATDLWFASQALRMM